MAPSFAGRRRNEGLGRSGSRSWVSSHGLGRADDNEVSSGRRGGERCRHARKCACTRRGGFRPLFIGGDASFARSRAPGTSIDTHRRRREPCSVTRSMGYRGRANLRKQEEPAPGSQRAGVARLAAWSPLPKRLAACHVRKGRRLRPPSLRGNEGSGLCPHVVMQLQKSAGDVGPKYAHASGLSKRGPAGVNGGLARSGRRR
jgi:hypothetical protein